MIEVRQTEVFADWLAALRDERAQARINVRIRRVSLGNLGDVKSVGEGVSELRIDYGPGYRLYLAQRGEVDRAALRRRQEIAGARHQDGEGEGDGEGIGGLRWL